MTRLSRLLGQAQAERPVSRRFPLTPATRFDAERTAHLGELLKLPRTARNDAWTDLFWDAAWTAALHVPDDPVITGPDGFRYLRMNLTGPEDGEVNSIVNIAAAMVDQGIGIAIFASAATSTDAADYVASMGALDGLLRFDDSRGEPAEVAEALENVGPGIAVAKVGGAERTELHSEQQALVGSPSEHYLSKEAARALHRHLVDGWGLVDPHVSLLMVPAMKPSRTLIIGKSVADFQSEGVDEQLMMDRVRMLAWYFPSSRRTALMPDDWNLANMTPLSALL